MKHNPALLLRVPSAFFSVSLTADPDEEATAEARAVVDKFIRETGWQPPQIETIAGALVSTQYSAFMPHMVKLIAKHLGRSGRNCAARIPASAPA